MLQLLVQLGLYEMAIPCYQRVLDIGNQLAKSGHVNPRLDLRREAAWNFACLLRDHGNQHMANQLCATYLCLD